MAFSLWFYSLLFIHFNTLAPAREEDAGAHLKRLSLFLLRKEKRGPDLWGADRTTCATLQKKKYDEHKGNILSIISGTSQWLFFPLKIQILSIPSLSILIV